MLFGKEAQIVYNMQINNILIVSKEYGYWILVEFILNSMFKVDINSNWVWFG